MTSQTAEIYRSANPQNLCRLCLKEREFLEPIFGSDAHCHIRELLTIEVDDTPGPTNICQICKYKLFEHVEFRRQCQENDAWLRDFHAEKDASKEPKEEIVDPTVESTVEESDVISTTEIKFEPSEMPPEDDAEFFDPNISNPECELLSQSTSVDYQPTYTYQFRCHLCPRKCRSRDIFEAHMKYDHSDQGVEPGHRYQCEQCDKSYPILYRLKRHVESAHNAVKPYGCDKCDKRFPQLDNLKKHYRVHAAQKPFVCELCSRGFTQAAALRIHFGTAHEGRHWTEVMQVKKDYRAIKREKMAQQKLMDMQRNLNVAVPSENQSPMNVDEAAKSLPNMKCS